MAISKFVDDTQTVKGSRAKSVFVFLGQDEPRSFRRAEVQMPAQADVSEFLAGMQDAALWQLGSEISQAAFIAAQERMLEDYYYNIMAVVVGVQMSEGSLDMALAAGLNAVAQYAPKAAQFSQWRGMMGLTNPETPQDKRDLLFGLLTFANTGILAGGIRNRRS
jgi:hypothetical protein